ncbi:glycosyltransferase [Aquabacterium sp. NJ1]|uniref:glycosyltransferase family 2 protein n=1 Tax=Aquabacterium sp. NJ1 TaxID=1538295 RepID=UPI0009DDE82F|nr:glycosyltransferase [Aquabacterium sp. NJ1]
MNEFLQDRAPLLSLLLITYNQQDTVRDALAAALSQTYQPLEIVVSDDASTDGSFEIMRRLLSDYDGPHKVILHRNETNQGIGANISTAVKLSSGELLVIAAGDDVSVPQRCQRMAEVWLASGCKLDLIASNLADMDVDGSLLGVMAPSDLSAYRSPSDWLAGRPYVIGAAQCWTRRLFDHFGPLPRGVVAEDLIMVFRAICLGGGASVPEPLVKYRRGGLSRRVRSYSAQDTIRRLLSNNRHALVEVDLLKRDAQKAGCAPLMRAWLDAEWALAVYIRDLFGASGRLSKVGIALRAGGVPYLKRLRLLAYAAVPELLAPWFWLKRMSAGKSR